MTNNRRKFSETATERPSNQDRRPSQPKNARRDEEFRDERRLRLRRRRNHRRSDIEIGEEHGKTSDAGLLKNS